MEEMPSINMPVLKLKVAILPLVLPCSGPVTNSGEFVTTGKSHRKTPDRTQITKERKIGQLLDKLLEYKRNWIQHVNRMPHHRLARVMNHYSPTGRRNHGRTLKRLWICDT
jgi:hypothetical protein